MQLQCPNEVRMSEVDRSVRENLVGEVDGMPSNDVVIKQILVDRRDLQNVPRVDRQYPLRLKIQRSRIAVQGTGLTVDEGSVEIALANCFLQIPLEVAQAILRSKRTT